MSKRRRTDNGVEIIPTYHNLIREVAKKVITHMEKVKIQRPNLNIYLRNYIVAGDMSFSESARTVRNGF